LKGLSPKGSRQFQQQFIRHYRLNSLCFIGWCIIIGHRTIIIWHTQSRHLISPFGEFFLLKGLSPKGSRQFQQQFIRHCRLNSLCFIGWCIIIGHRTIIIWHTQSRHLISPSGEFFY